MSIEGKISLITGAGRGLGRATALRMAGEGANLIVADLDQETVHETAREVEAKGSQVLVTVVDVTDSRQVKKMVSQAKERFKRIDIIIHCAGIARGKDQWGDGNWKPMEDLGENDWREIIEVNLTGTFLCNLEVGKVMIEQRNGKIINVASFAAVVANRGLLGHGAYCAAKAGVIALTRVLATEWAKYNINVNCISPGFMNTRLVERFKKNLPDVHKMALEMTPMGRFGEPDEFARTVVFLASEDSNFVTGHNLIMDGGYTAW